MSGSRDPTDTTPHCFSSASSPLFAPPSLSWPSQAQAWASCLPLCGSSCDIIQSPDPKHHLRTDDPSASISLNSTQKLHKHCTLTGPQMAPDPASPNHCSSPGVPLSEHLLPIIPKQQVLLSRFSFTPMSGQLATPSKYVPNLALLSTLTAASEVDATHMSSLELHTLPSTPLSHIPLIPTFFHVPLSPQPLGFCPSLPTLSPPWSPSLHPALFSFIEPSHIQQIFKICLVSGLSPPPTPKHHKIRMRVEVLISSGLGCVPSISYSVCTS